MLFTFIGLDLKSTGGIQTYCKQIIDKFKQEKIYKIKEIELNKKNIFSLKIIYFLYYVFKSKHVYLLHVSLINIFFLTLFRKKISIFFYGIDIFKLKSSIIKFILKKNIYINYLTCSNYSKNFAVTNLKIKKENIEVIYPYSNFENIVSKIKYQNIHNKKIKILSVSRLDGRITDGIWLMLEALKYNDNKEIEFHIVGEGKQISNMKKFISENKLYNIYFHGYQKDLIKYYEETDLSLSITDNAGFGISVLDSIFFGKPCIVSRNSASFEIFNNKNYNFSIENESSLEELILLLKNLKHMKIINNNFVDFYKQNYSIKIFSKKINIYKNKISNDN